MGSDPDGPDRVVVADPTETVAGRVEPPLEAAGFEVIAVDSASECLRAVERGDVFGVFSVDRLPDISGLNLLRSIRIARPDLPFLLVTREESAVTADRAAAAGVDDVLSIDADPGGIVDRLGAVRTGGADRRVSESYHRYRHLLEISPAPIDIFDAEGTILWGNDAVLSLLGLDERADLVGRSIFEFIHEEDREVARAELASVIERKSSTGPTPMKLDPPETDVRYIRVATATGRYLGTDIGQAVIVDVTELKARERQLEVLDTWLRHNIRNDMNVVAGIAEDIRRGAVDDVDDAITDIHRIADRVVDQADRERAVISLLTDPPELKAIGVEEAVRTAVERIREGHPEATIDVASLPPVEVRTVPRLATVVTELLENAIVHNDRSPPTVTVRVEVDEADRVDIGVSDDGPGIPAVERELLALDFELDQLRHGSGLGLAEAHWVARLSGGELRFADREPRGSTVTLTLPLATAE